MDSKLNMMKAGQWYTNIFVSLIRIWVRVELNRTDLDFPVKVNGKSTKTVWNWSFVVDSSYASHLRGELIVEEVEGEFGEYRTRKEAWDHFCEIGARIILTELDRTGRTYSRVASRSYPEPIGPELPCDELTVDSNAYETPLTPGNAERLQLLEAELEAHEINDVINNDVKFYSGHVMKFTPFQLMRRIQEVICKASNASTGRVYTIQDSADEIARALTPRDAAYYRILEGERLRRKIELGQRLESVRSDLALMAERRSESSDVSQVDGDQESSESLSEAFTNESLSVMAEAQLS